MAPLQTGGVNDVWSYHEIVLDSSARDAGTPDRPVFNLPHPLTNVMGFQLLEVDIPLTYGFINEDNCSLGIGINDNDFSIPRPTAMPVYLPLGTYNSALDLAQAIGDQYDLILERDWPGQFRMQASLDSSGHIVLSLTDRSTGAFVPPDPTKVYAMSIYVHESRNPNRSPWDLRQLLGFDGTSRYGLPNTVTAPNLPDFSLPRHLLLRSNLAQRCSRRLQYDGSSASVGPCLMRFDLRLARNRKASCRVKQSAMYFATELETVQSITLDLTFGGEPWSRYPVQLNDQPWTLKLALLRQRST